MGSLLTLLKLYDRDTSMLVPDFSVILLEFHVSWDTTVTATYPTRFLLKAPPIDKSTKC